MPSSIIQWFKPPPARPRLSPVEVERLYPLYRWQVFESAFIAYGTFYIVRNNFAPVSREIGAALHYDKVMIGDILAATSIAYGIGKLVLGYLADRSDSRKYLAVGMLLTALVNFAFGSTTHFNGHLLLWTLNGFVQGMGYGPCARGLSHWYSVKERGTIFGAWNTAHCFGGGAAGFLAATCAQYWGWPSAFYVPGVIALICAIYLFWRMRDTPQSEGLPGIEEFKNDWPPEEMERHEQELSFREMFLHYILPNKMLWVLAFANIFVYIARYAMVDWGPTYLKEVKGASLMDGGFSTLVIEVSGAVGMIVMGWLSDKIGGRRARLSALAMIPLVPAFLVLILSGSNLLTSREITAPESLIKALQSGDNRVAQFIWSQIPPPSQSELTKSTANSDTQRFILANDLNLVLRNTALYEPSRFAGISLRAQTQGLLSMPLKDDQLIYCNRLLLEDAFPGMVTQSHFTPAQLLWLNLVLFGFIGFFVYTPVTFSGVVALDLTSKKAAATAAGFVGFFGYVGGRVLQGFGLGWIAQHYGWDAGLYAIIGCIILGAALLAFLWNVKPRG